MPIPTRILLIDDHSLFREAIARLLGAEPDFEVVGEAATVEMQSGLPPGLMSSDDVVTKADPGEPASGRGAQPKRGSRSLLGFFFLALVAAAAGGIFVMQCEKDRAAHGDTSTATP